jgi:hypothetical protein
MADLLAQYGQLFYHRFEIRMIATDDVVFDAWTGAVVRNNFLFAADKIFVNEHDMSLREWIDTFPLNEAHLLYKELKDGFPRGYVLTDFSHADLQSSSVEIRKNEVFSFSILLIGNVNEYRAYFFQAIREMCARGIGKPRTPFLLLDISEKTASGKSEVIAIAQTDLTDELHCPVRLSDFIRYENESEIILRYLTPIILFRLKNKKNTQLSYQDKCNRFPSFYQLVRSAFFRLQKLYAIYMEPEKFVPELFDETLRETFLEKAGYPLLQSADIRYIMLQNTQKKEKVNDIPLAGYIGEEIYAGYFREYVPLLRFMSELGVGNETVYGMGRYEID